MTNINKRGADSRGINRRPWDAADIAELKRLAKVGKTLPEMSAILGKTTDSVRKKCGRLSVQYVGQRPERSAAPTGPRTDEDLDQHILDICKAGPTSIGDISRRLDRSKETISIAIERLFDRGYDITVDDAEKRAILQRAAAKHFRPLQLDKPASYYKIGAVSDTHFGSKFQQMTLLHTAYAELAKERVDFCVHCGDMTDGINMYRGQANECFLGGADDMVEYTAKNYPKAPFKTYVIGGNHDMSFKKAAGFNVVRAICGLRDDLVYRGEESTSFQVQDALIELLHPSGGVPYARSYRPQKIIEGLVGEILNVVRYKKDMAILPHVLFTGHYHIAHHLPAYFGMECYSVPCFQAQTPYLKAKGLAPAIGYIIIEIWMNKERNIIRVRPDFRYMGDRLKKEDY